MNDAKARIALHDIKAIIDRHAVKVWLDCGTLLGAVREGDFIVWDNDIDLAMWAADIVERDAEPLWRDLHYKNFNVYLLDDKLILDRDGVPINVSLYHRGGADAYRDIYPLHINWFSKVARVPWWIASARVQTSAARPGLSRSPVSLGKRLLVGAADFLPDSLRRQLSDSAFRVCLAAGCQKVDWRVPLEFFEEFGSLEFSGDEWLVPRDSVAYLRFRYGDDWRTPNRNFSSVNDDGAIRR